MCAGVANDRHPAVVRRVERLVGVGRPRVGAVHAGPPGPHVADRAAAQSPKAPSTCTHAPRVVGELDDRPERVEGPGVDVARLGRTRWWARWPRAAPLRAPLGSEPALIVGSDQFRLAESQGSAARRSIDAVSFGAGQHPDLRRPVQAVGRRFQPAAASTESRAAASAVKLAIVAPVTKPTADSVGGGAASRIHRRLPPRRDDPGSRVAHAGVLVPRADQPVGGEGGGQGARP